jgi:hypothetical protein
MKFKIGITLGLISVFVFLFVNLLENLIYYNIGYNANEKQEEDEKKVVLPTTQDWVRIIMVMILFAILQGFLTLILFEYEIGEK